MDCFSFRQGIINPGIEVTLDAFLKGYAIHLGSSELLGSSARVAMFRSNPPFVEEKSNRRFGTIYQAHPVLVTVGKSVYQTLAKPNDPTDAIILRVNTIGKFHEEDYGYIKPVEGQPSLLARAAGAHSRGSHISIYDDALYLVRLDDVLDVGIEGGEEYQLKNEGGKAQLTEI